MSKWFSVRAAARKGSAQVYLYSDIGEGGVTAEAFANELRILGAVDELHINIGSNGGDVSTGFAIFNMLKRHTARKIVTIDGLAASMASVIAMAGDEILIPDDSMLMVHEPFGVVAGRADEVSNFGGALDAMRNQIAQAYASRSGMSLSKVLGLMKAETWITAAEAVKLGLADRVIDANQMAAKVDVSKFKNAPVAYARANTFDEIRTRAFSRFNSPPAQAEEPRSRRTPKTLDALHDTAFARFNNPKPREVAS